MKRSIFLLLFLGLNTTGLADELVCRVKVNAEVSSEEKIAVAPGSAAEFGKLQPYRFKVRNDGNSRPGKFGIEVFDPETPSRSYADGVLRDASDEVQWSLWTREILLEAACQLVGR